MIFVICKSAASANGDQHFHLEVDTMIGCVNLFIHPLYKLAELRQLEYIYAELEVAIAEKQDRRKGYGRAATLAFLNYILHHESGLIRELHTSLHNAHRLVLQSKLSHLEVNIIPDDRGSIALFESMGFSRVGETPSLSMGKYRYTMARDIIDVQAMASASGALAGYEETERSSSRSTESVGVNQQSAEEITRPVEAAQKPQKGKRDGKRKASHQLTPGEFVVRM